MADTEAALPVRSDERAFLVVRYKPGLIRESERVFHLVEDSGLDDVPELVGARCGKRLIVEQLEVLLVILGAPCEGCMATTRAPGAEWIRTAMRRGIEPGR